MPINGPNVVACMLAARQKQIDAGTYVPATGIELNDLESPHGSPVISPECSEFGTPLNSRPVTPDFDSFAPPRPPSPALSDISQLHGWDLHTEKAPVYQLPHWMTRMGLVDEVPDWMKTADGSGIGDIERSLRADPELMEKALLQQKPKRKPCQVFANMGFCKFGLDCEFRHDIGLGSQPKVDPGVDPKITATINARLGSNNNSRRRKKKVVEHVSSEEEEDDGPPKEKIWAACPDFKKKGKCRKGDKCQYFHV